MKKNLIALAMVASFALPFASFAATYGYINTSGVLATVTADNATQALALPTDIKANSGVILLSGTPDMMTMPAATAASTTMMVMPEATTSMASSSMMMTGTTSTSSMMTASSSATSTMSASTTASTTTM